MCTIWWLDTAAAPPDQFNSGRFSYNQTVRTIAASIVDDFSPSMASTSAAERRFPVSNTSKVPSPTSVNTVSSTGRSASMIAANRCCPSTNTPRVSKAMP